jgi:hypothetical protein
LPDALAPESTDYPDQVGPGQSWPYDRQVATSPAPKAGRRRHRPGLAAIVAFLALCGVAVAAFGIWRARQPRIFTPAQRASIEAWEVASRWRAVPKSRIFPMVVRYRLGGALRLTARRLEIAPQAACAGVAGADPKVVALLTSGGCQAILRATYTDATSSLALTVGVAVMRNHAAALAASRFLTASRSGSPGAVSRRLVLRPLAVPGTPAAAFGLRQRQLSWVADAGPYLIVATVGFADGRRHVPVATDRYSYLEMTSLARGVVARIAWPLGRPAPVPHCPGGPAC